MDIKIEKIENGYLVSMGNRRFHATCPEEICGATSEWVLDECGRVDKMPTYADLSKVAISDLARQGVAAAARQAEAWPPGLGTPFAKSVDPTPEGLSDLLRKMRTGGS